MPRAISIMRAMVTRNRPVVKKNNLRWNTLSGRMISSMGATARMFQSMLLLSQNSARSA